MKNRIDEVFKNKKKILSIYFSAGHPNLEDTTSILKKLQSSGADMIEIGLPFSDPLADGPVIQKSSSKALRNGMTTEKLFNQLEGVRKEINIPLIIMGYFNPIMQYGVEKFCEKCKLIGIDGLIIPDLPVSVYKDDYKELFDKHGLYNMFLITPQTSVERINYIDKASKGFIYMVSSSGVTGVKSNFNEVQTKYFKRIKSMNLNTPTIIGFGISNQQTFNSASEYSSGAIIGSAFINFLETKGVVKINEFIKSIR
ncbi:MAG: tryptophan synthase alpha chain [Candidatus Marivariicella framensis]|jgi:tryptophan synthase alpha chain|tara:strand:+ start:3406 stop:4170 length:765 start_codon:yes stop_codon:yes gene_type:complete